MDLKINVSDFVDLFDPNHCVFDNVSGIINLGELKEFNINKLTIKGECKLKINTNEWSILNIDQLRLVDVKYNEEIIEFYLVYLVLKTLLFQVQIIQFCLIVNFMTSIKKRLHDWKIQK